MPKSSNLLRLDPFLDPNGLLRVGGRLRNSTLEYQEKHPVLLPKGHHVSKLIIRHFHEKVHHQGRQITSRAVREAGYWAIGAHHMISSLIESCVTCKKLRGAILTQHMANLPSDRLETSPPFSNIGFDVFGPWEIATRRLRGGAVLGSRFYLSKQSCHPHRAFRNDGCQLVHLRSVPIPRHSWPSGETQMRPGYQLCGRKISIRRRTLGDGPNSDPKVYSRARGRMDIQSSTCIALRRRVGAANWYDLTRIGHHASGDWTCPAHS